jgi:hypothetical protein
MAESANPWEKKDGEPDEAYARFLMYRGLGPGRSVLAAYNLFTRTFRNAAQNSPKTPTQVPGHWSDDCARWSWVDRAHAWDVHVLHTHGERLSVLWVGILTLAAEKCAQKLAQPGCRPKDFMQAVSVIDKLSAFLTPDAIKSLQPDHGPAGPKQKPVKSAVK